MPSRAGTAPLGCLTEVCQLLTVAETSLKGHLATARPRRRRTEILVDGETKTSASLRTAPAEDNPGDPSRRAMSSPTSQHLELTLSLEALLKRNSLGNRSCLEGKVCLQLNPESFIKTKTLQGNKGRLLSAHPKPQDIQYTKGNNWVT